MLNHFWDVVVISVLSGTPAADPGTSDVQKQAPDLRATIERLERVESALQKIDENQLRMAERVGKDVNELRIAVADLRRDVDELRRTTTSRKPVEDGPAKVMLMNDHPTQTMDAMVNGMTHAVPPGKAKTIDVPSGRLSIQVMQTDANARTRVLQPGETKIVTMR